MFKRAAASVLWFLATLTAYSFAALVLDAPRVLGPVIAFVVALLVAIDPAGLLWEPSTTRSVVQPKTGSARTAGHAVARD